MMDINTQHTGSYWNCQLLGDPSLFSYCPHLMSSPPSSLSPVQAASISLIWAPPESSYFPLCFLFLPLQSIVYRAVEVDFLKCESRCIFPLIKSLQ